MHRTLRLLPLLLPAILTAQDSSSAYTKPYQQQALAIYRSSIAIESSEGKGRVPELAKLLADRFRAGGFADSDIHLLPIELPSGEKTASLVVRYRGDGTSGARPILLVAHMDVVPARTEDWVRHPFTLTEENGYFYGRGVEDDKFGVAMLSGTFLRLKAEGWVPNRDLILALTGDEETGMLTAKDLSTNHRDLIDAEYALNADAGGGTFNEDGTPQGFLVETSEKTYATFELTITNPGGHSSTPRDDNAIYELAAILRNIQAYRFPVEMNEATTRFFTAMAPITPGPVGKAMASLVANPGDSAAAEVLWHQPELVGITRTTCVATMLRAGHAENALPQSATATVNCRIFPGTEVSAVRATLRRVAADPELKITTLGTPESSPASPIRDDVMAAVAQGVQRIHPGTPIIPLMAPYATDGKPLRRAGIPTYGVMGLFLKASDMMAHGLNERVTVRAFFDGLEFWHAVLRQLAGPATS